tara:strand:+ start:1057 stop:1227 length:171 start_codon:yes stop_codon:yes gene_type:complete
MLYNSNLEIEQNDMRRIDIEWNGWVELYAAIENREVMGGMPKRPKRPKRPTFQKYI